jgi:signal transduction histidine kinase
MYVLGFLAARETLSTVCKEELCTLRLQIRHTDMGEQIVQWPGPPIGYANPLQSDQVKALGRLGLTLDQYGWLAALQIGLPVLVYLLIAAGLFWWKSNDWMVLFASVMVATIPVGNGPLPFILVARQPVWVWAYDAVNVIGLSCFLQFPLIFPTGRFVPHWTRWIALFEIVGAIIITLFSNSISASARIKSLVVVYLLISFGTGVYAQLYRYFRMASPVERQQLKWVVVGLAGFIGIAFIVLLPLDALLTSRAASMDSARALLLSVIPDTFFQVILLFIPVTIAISVLRYRLWDIDVIISRALVYGILSAGIVVSYILLVGLLGTLFDTNVSLAAALVTASLTIPFFQPSRTRVQSVVNHITFGRRDAQDPKQEIEELQPEPEMLPRPRWLEVVHSAWFVLALVVGIILLSAVSAYYRHYPQAIFSAPVPSQLGQFNLPFQILIGLGDLAESFMSFALAILLFWRKPNDRMTLFASFFLLITTVTNGYMLDYFLTAKLGAPSTRDLYALLEFPLWILLFCIFPDGRFVPRWTRSLFLVSIITSFAFFVVPFSILQYTVGPQFILVTYAQVYRYRHSSSEVERKQTKWVVLGWLVVMVLSLISSLIYRRPTGPLINIFPLMLAIAILRSRLWNIDLILNRTLVYGALTAGIITLYILLVGALSLLSQTTGNLLISLLATGLIAFLFQPLRERLQGSVNRLLYGDRDDPYAALSRLGRRLESTITPEAVLPTIVTTVREALKLPYTAIYLKQPDDDYKIIAESASPSLRVENGKIRVPGMEREGKCIPLIHQGETLGYLVLGPRTPSEAFSSSDLRLVDDLAPQVGVAVHAIRLTSDLQRSREQLVLAREEERRRLRRDLHDDLGPTLASLGLTASAAALLISTDPNAATRMVNELESQIRATVGNVRRLVYDLRPPTLDELGLLAAVRERASRYSNAPNGFHVTVEAPTQLPPLPAAVEVAAYRIVQEALTNIAKHAQAQQCTICFRYHTGLEIEITDDGIGLPQSITPGVGLRSMRERAEELGGSCLIERRAEGGPRIQTRLPIGQLNGSATSLDG